MYFVLDQCPILRSPDNGYVNETVTVNNHGVLYSAKYSCKPGYALIVKGRRKQTSVRICNPKIDFLSKDNKVVKRNQFSGKDPMCKSKNPNFLYNRVYNIHKLVYFVTIYVLDMFKCTSFFLQWSKSYSVLGEMLVTA